MTPFDGAQGAPSASRGAGRIGVLGGTFDPIHYGHLDAAAAARTALGLHDILFIPSHDPPHRPADPTASGFHRFAMLSLAIDGENGYRVSDLELTRPGPTYTADTLRELHARGWAASQIFFILGADAFAEIAHWREYPAVLEAAHFAVVARPGVSLETALARAPELRARTRDVRNDPIKSSGTGVYLVQAETRDVSSTVIRGRLAARRSITDLVPAAVARHITAHHLYGAEDDLHGDS
jgi:nicotinate-nucleotide adenylyltransferase